MNTPLAVRMRPRTIDEIVGQNDILNNDSLLTKMIKEDMLSSIILYGPPGTGKTTIANVIANSTHAKFEQVNAVTDGKKELEKVCVQARKDLEANGTRTILFIDAIELVKHAYKKYLQRDEEERIRMKKKEDNCFYVTPKVKEYLESNNINIDVKLIEEDVKKMLDLPDSWKILSQMPFGSIEKTPAEKTFLPLENRLVIFR